MNVLIGVAFIIGAVAAAWFIIDLEYRHNNPPLDGEFE